MATLFVLLMGFGSTSAQAQSCAPAASQGTAPQGWETYCWLDFSTYNDATARSAAGQNFSFNLNDGSTLSFNLKVTPTTAAAFNSIAAPSWTGAAVGNTAFLGIPGRPVLYTSAAGSKSITFSGITITPPPGAPAVTAYSFVAADAESTNDGENLQFVTNGTGWQILDQVNPISGNNYPTITGTGTSTFTETGVPGTVGGYIVGSNSPTTVTTNMQAGGLQGAMFAVRFASIRLRKTITGARVNAADQFTFRVSATSSGTTLASGTTTGTGNGPFSATPLSLASGIGLTLSEAMAAGSVSTLAKYQSRLTCTNTTTSSTTPLPNNLLTTSYNFGALQFGDAVICVFNNAAFPHIRISKALGAGGRRFNTDQFTVRINQASTVVASATTTGTGTTVTGGNTGLVQVTPGTAYTLDEIMFGPGSLSQYTSALACTNATNGVTTTFPTTVPGNITPVLGDVISCVVTNTRLAGNATLVVSKTSTVLSDGVSAANPKSIPGAIVRYTITVQNTGNLSVDANSIVIVDAFPPNFTLDASTPFTFTEGARPSNLNAFNQGTMVTYSNTGSAPFTAPLGSGYNAAIRAFRYAPTGTMQGANATGPSSFSISFVGRLN
ncbi:MAG TPA: CshA/CshB family fibrillar adhesin-related protein [Sphingorhabdus lacus]|nr:CshA/CshB family fibrillar adhesin-related protein [Sphingorhabdus lacus]HPV68025.1 CshA/CshB family fibrillar adhesin-related protein [Sphingorhabdus lacus]